MHPVLGCCAVPAPACAALPTRARGQLPKAKRQIINSFQKTGNHFRQATANMFLQRDFPESGPCARSQLRAMEPLTLIPRSIFPPDSFRIWASTSRAKLTHRASWFEFEETLVSPPPFRLFCVGGPFRAMGGEGCEQANSCRCAILL